MHGASTGLNEAVFWGPPPGLKQTGKKKARKKKKRGKAGEEEGRKQAGEKLGHRWEEKNNAVQKKAEKGGWKWSLTCPHTLPQSPHWTHAEPHHVLYLKLTSKPVLQETVPD